MTGRLAATVLATAAVPPLLLGVLGMGQTASQATVGASVGGLPAVAVAAYRLAAVRAAERWGCTVPASLIGAVGSVESGHGTVGGAQIDPDTGQVDPPIYGPVLDGSEAGGNVTPIFDSDDGELDGHRVYDRAVGPMQLLPATWRRFEAATGLAGDPHNYYDATLAAAWHLCNGRQVDLTDPDAAGRAVAAYNRSDVYVLQVLAEQQLLAALLDGTWGRADAGQLLVHPRFSVSPHARADLAAGLVDARLVGLLWTMVDDLELGIYASPFRTGHSRCVGGGPDDAPACSESHHWYGRAVDIGLVSGERVAASNGAARALTDWLATLASVDELSITVGSPWGDYTEHGFFTDAAHRDHIHLSVCGPRLRAGQLWDDCR